MSPTATSNAQVTARQLWGQISTASATEQAALCTPLILPSGGMLVFGDNDTSTLSARITFKLPCANPESIISPDTTGNSSVIGFQDPFYASISPQIFALAAATVISYILVILIFITPRTFVIGGPGGGAGFLGRRGMIPGSSNIIGVGRRPLLQKIATVTVAISLTIATADTFSVAKDQYNQGYMDSSLLVDGVVGSLEIRIIRVISDTFLWLAQVQTLIRLFPRHKEKVTIKWLGFAMVSSDTIFSILDSFVSRNPRTRPRSFQDVIPALNYLFELAISIIYASCVVYYCLSKRRFAFWHPKMKNICLVAIISLTSVAIPAVFFVLDISQPDLAGWGEYIRWVGAAAASVVVWEWVERIESLERDQRKDGILGRELFDGDEMLNMTPSEDASWRGRDPKSGLDGGFRKSVTVPVTLQVRRLHARLPLRKRRRAGPSDGIVPGTDAASAAGPRIPPNAQLVVPTEQIVTPNRSDTGSATSTVYAIRYHHLTSPSPNLQQDLPPQQPVPHQDTMVDAPKTVSDPSGSELSPSSTDKEIGVEQHRNRAAGDSDSRYVGRQIWSGVPNPFKRRRAEPPAEVADAQIASGVRRSPIDSRLNMRGRLGAFAAAQRDRFTNRGGIPAAPLPVTVIPAPKTNDRTWSPDDLRDVRSSNESAAGADFSSEEQQHSGQAHHEPPASGVVIIPAPTHGRTWSPDALNNQTTRQTAPSGLGSSVQRPLSVVTRNSFGSSSGANMPPNVYTSRGSLTISESESRAVSSPRRSTYSRPPKSTVIEEPSDTAVEGLDHAQERGETDMTTPLVDSEATAPSREDLQTFQGENLRQTSPQDDGGQTNARDADARNTGGGTT
ncbi:uncharacterized protein A1O9_10447 [Exophiala aquamarina CBS 119918]|uniref:PH-response regulator protein palH/RIM21 n=1 Tax=Exophiala aquamarina CBS 119918 TaxID=1182545 RepID=A0A072P1B9_9EURO|nr:uncharacterized protein A1O9_10447 [Exophiala aquamarina CBS 119918]KEF53472.1 hypothetical protein A1O9_10447 [Exophiala aquamarina CBS 119918]